MEENTRTLHQLCGIDEIKPRRSATEWLEVTLKFIGGESYVLGTKRAELSLKGSDGGFGLRFKDHLALPAEALLGKSIKEGYLTDIRIVFPKGSGVPELSLASMTQGVYPFVLRTGEMVRIS